MFVLTFRSVNDLPTISDIPNRSVNEDTSTGPIAFTVGDVETVDGSLTLSASSSNPVLVPTNSISFGGSGSSRTVTVLPALKQFGVAIITVTVRDADGGTASDSFALTVNPVNDPPTLNPIGNVVTNEDSGIVVVNLTGISGGPPNEPQAVSITVSNSNPTLLSSVTVSYSTNSPTVAALGFTPALNSNGVATITVTVNDNTPSNNLIVRSFTVTITPENDAPFLSTLPNVTVDEDTPTAALPFILGDVETPAALLTVSAVSSNTNLVPVTNIVFTGTESNRTVRVTPAPDRFGATVITITVRDPEGATASVSFTVIVRPVNDPPVIAAIGPQVSDEDQSRAVAFTIIDVETTDDALTVSADSSNLSLLPPTSIVVSGAGSNRVATLNPATNVFGATTVTLTVSDGTNNVSRSFLFTVAAVNDPPTLAAIANVTVNEDSGLHTVALAGLSTGVSNEVQILTITAVSSNPALVPHPEIIYLHPQSTGTLSFVTMPDAAGRRPSP